MAPDFTQLLAVLDASHALLEKQTHISGSQSAFAAPLVLLPTCLDCRDVSRVLSHTVNVSGLAPPIPVVLATSMRIVIYIAAPPAAFSKTTLAARRLQDHTRVVAYPTTAAPPPIF